MSQSNLILNKFNCRYSFKEAADASWLDWTKIERLLTVLFPLTVVKGIVELGRVVGHAQWVDAGRVYNYKWQERLEYCDEFTLKHKFVFLENCAINHYLLWHKTNKRKMKTVACNVSGKTYFFVSRNITWDFLDSAPPSPQPFHPNNPCCLWLYPLLQIVVLLALWPDILEPRHPQPTLIRARDKQHRGRRWWHHHPRGHPRFLHEAPWASPVSRVPSGT